jgi:hypothetical protein
MGIVIFIAQALPKALCTMVGTVTLALVVLQNQKLVGTMSQAPATRSMAIARWKERGPSGA